jgi:hypothetical protein
MLQTISWTGYISVIILILAVYYIYLVVKRYRDKFKKFHFFKGRQLADENEPDEANQV